MHVHALATLLSERAPTLTTQKSREAPDLSWKWWQRKFTDTTGNASPVIQLVDSHCMIIYQVPKTYNRCLKKTFYWDNDSTSPWLFSLVQISFASRRNRTQWTQLYSNNCSRSATGSNSESKIKDRSEATLLKGEGGRYSPSHVFNAPTGTANGNKKGRRTTSANFH